jgi:hypothetical protein
MRVRSYGLGGSVWAAVTVVAAGGALVLERYSWQHIKVKEREDGDDQEQPDHGRSHDAAIGFRERLFFESVGVNREIAITGSIVKRHENSSQE